MKRLNGYMLKVSAKVCEDAGKKIVGADLGGHRQVCGLRAEENSIETVCQGIPDEIQRALLVCELFLAIPPLEAVKALVSIMMFANWTSKGELMKLRHHYISRAHFQGTAQRLIYIRLPAEERQKCGEAKVGR